MFLRCDSIAYIVYYSNLPAILYHDELSRPELDAELSVYLSIYLSIYLSYICCVCRKHIFGHVLRIDASLDYILLILTKPLSFFYFSLHHNLSCVPRLLLPSFELYLHSFRTGLAFFKIYFGLIFVMCARFEIPSPIR